MKTFKGLSLEPVDTLSNIVFIIESGHLLTVCSDTEYVEIGDILIGFARDYAEAARDHMLENKK